MHVGEGPHNPNIGYTGGNLYKPPDVVHLVFTTESDEKQSQRRRYMEVNATMPAVQRFMCGSEQPHDWSQKDHPKVMPNPGGYAHLLCTVPVQNVDAAAIIDQHLRELDV